jgi:hypothetical protein
MSESPNELAAITAAAGVLSSDPADMDARMWATAVVRAAAPHIRADERARIRSLLPYNVNCCEGFPAAVADLIGEHEDTPSASGEAVPPENKES